MLVSQNLEPLVKPLESIQHSHASLLPKHTRNLSLMHWILFHLVICIELRMLIVAHCHGSSLMKKLRICVHGLFEVQGWRLHQCGIWAGELVIITFYT